jgi:hypothetical protein
MELKHSRTGSLTAAASVSILKPLRPGKAENLMPGKPNT